MQGAAAALTAGIDMGFLDASYSPSILQSAINTQRITPNDVNRAAGNILAAKFAAGLFDGQLPDPAARPNIYR